MTPEHARSCSVRLVGVDLDLLVAVRLAAVELDRVAEGFRPRAAGALGRLERRCVSRAVVPQDVETAFSMLPASSFISEALVCSPIRAQASALDVEG
jgi:hypothetical protein